MDGWMAGKWMGFHWVFATTHVLLLFPCTFPIQGEQHVAICVGPHSPRN